VLESTCIIRVQRLRQICAGSQGRQVAITVSRYRPSFMRAVHLTYQSPKGEHSDLVAIGEFVVVPEDLRRQPGLWWLEKENHPHLLMEDAKTLEDAVGAIRLGCWPFCVPAARWNKAAAEHPRLPRSPTLDPEPDDPQSPTTEGSRTPRLGQPSRSTPRMEAAAERTPLRCVVIRLNDGRTAVRSLFAPLAWFPRVLLSSASLIGCAYYGAAVASWLWALRGGIDSIDVQGGVALVFAGLFASWITRSLAPRLGSSRSRRHSIRGIAGRGNQPILQLASNVYRAGVALQLLAFTGFIVT
jgi:hypothetical protein